MSFRGFERENNGAHEPLFQAEGNNYLFTIAIDAYEHCGKLQNARKDAEDLIDCLMKHYRFDEPQLFTLFDEAATKEHIFAGFRKLAELLGPNDNLLVYFSGHGHFDDVLKEGYWIPVEAHYASITDYISYSYLLKAIKAIQARHILVIADSCYSGGIFVDPGRRSNISIDRFERDPSRWMLASGRNEVVPDGQGESNSPFARQLLDTLENYASVGIRTSSLIEKVVTATIHNSPQTPIGRPLYGVGDKGGEFVFHPRHRLAKVEENQKLPPKTPSSPFWKNKNWWRRHKKWVRSLMYIMILTPFIIFAFGTRKSQPVALQLKVDAFSFRNESSRLDLFYDEKPVSFQMLNCTFAAFTGDSLLLDMQGEGRYAVREKLSSEFRLRPLPGGGRAFTTLSLTGATLSSFSIPPDAEVWIVKEPDESGRLHLSFQDATPLPLEVQYQEQLSFATELVSLETAHTQQSYPSAIWGKVVMADKPGGISLEGHEQSNAFNLDFGDSLNLLVHQFHLSNLAFGLRDRAQLISSLQSGSVFYFDHQQDTAEVIRLGEREDLKLEADTPWVVRSMRISEGGIELHIEGVAKNLYTGALSTARMPTRIYWWWSTRKLELAVTFLALLGLGYVFTGKPMDVFLEKLGGKLW